MSETMTTITWDGETSTLDKIEKHFPDVRWQRNGSLRLTPDRWVRLGETVEVDHPAPTSPAGQTFPERIARVRGGLADLLEEFHVCGGNGPDDVMDNGALLDVLAPWVTQLVGAGDPAAAVAFGTSYPSMGEATAAAMDANARRAALAQPAAATDEAGQA